MAAREHHLPFSAEAGRFMLEEVYWPRLEGFVNGPLPDDGHLRDLYLRLHDRLAALIRGEHFSGAVRPRLRLVSNRHGVFWGVERARNPRDLQDELRTALVLLQEPASRALLRRCDGCGHFYLGRRRE